VVLYQRIHHGAIGGETWNHVGLADDELSIQNVIIGIVAAVEDKGKFYNHSRGVSLTVGAGVRLVGRHSVVGQKLSVALSVDDDAPAGAFHIGGDIEPAADEVQFLILQRVRINRDGSWQDGPVGVLGRFLAARKEGEECH